MDLVIKACDMCPPPQPGQVPPNAREQVFSFDGSRLVVDLCGNHTAEFQRAWQAVARFTEDARPAPVGRASTATSPRKRTRHAANPENEKIRAWAKEQGMEVGDKGRISEELRAAYARAHTQQPRPYPPGATGHAPLQNAV